MDQLYWTEFSNAGAKATCEKVDAQWQQFAAQHPDAFKGRTPIGVTYGNELGQKWGMGKAPPGTFHAEDLQFFLDRYDGPKSAYTLEAASDEALALLAQQPDPTPVQGPAMDQNWLQKLNDEADKRLSQWQPQEASQVLADLFSKEWNGNNS
jgi:hypothetical protein